MQVRYSLHWWSYTQHLSLPQTTQNQSFSSTSFGQHSHFIVQTSQENPHKLCHPKPGPLWYQNTCKPLILYRKYQHCLGKTSVFKVCAPFLPLVSYQSIRVWWCDTCSLCFFSKILYSYLSHITLTTSVGCKSERSTGQTIFLNCFSSGFGVILFDLNFC